VLSASSTEDNQTEYVLPKGWKIAQSPAPRQIDTPLALFRLEVQTEGERATVKTHLEYRKSRFTPAEYRALRDFLSQVDGSLDQVFEIRPER